MFLVSFSVQQTTYSTVPGWQPRILLGIVEARSVNAKKTATYAIGSSSDPKSGTRNIYFLFFFSYFVCSTWSVSQDLWMPLPSNSVHVQEHVVCFMMAAAVAGASLLIRRTS